MWESAGGGLHIRPSILTPNELLIWGGLKGVSCRECGGSESLPKSALHYHMEVDAVPVLAENSYAGKNQPKELAGSHLLWGHPSPGLILSSGLEISGPWRP